MLTKAQHIVYNTVDTARMARATEYFELIAKRHPSAESGWTSFAPVPMNWVYQPTKHWSNRVRDTC
jgi:hypothetical protein